MLLVRKRKKKSIKPIKNCIIKVLEYDFKTSSSRVFSALSLYELFTERANISIISSSTDLR